MILLIIRFILNKLQLFTNLLILFKMVYYYSKWRNEWIAFKNQPPSEGELMQMKKLHYQITIK